MVNELLEGAVGGLVGEGTCPVLCPARYKTWPRERGEMDGGSGGGEMWFEVWSGWDSSSLRRL